MTKIKKYLKSLGACQNGINFASKFETLEQAWRACYNPRDLLWYLGETKQGTKEQYVKVAIFSAELVIDIYSKEYPQDSRPQEAIQITKKWLLSQAASKAASSAASKAAYAASSAASKAASSAAEIEIKISQFIRETFQPKFNIE